MITNYLRDAAINMRGKTIPSLIKNGNLELAESIEHLLESAAQSEKFIIPNSGRLIDDSLSALPSELRLPFPSVVIEYYVDTDNPGAHAAHAVVTKITPVRKRVIFAQECDEGIVVSCLFKYEPGPELNLEAFWSLFPFAAIIPRNAKLDAPILTAEGLTIAKNASFGIVRGYETLVTKEAIACAGADFNDELRVVMEFLEALACSNVGFSEHESSRKPGAKLKKEAIPFDCYRRLTVKIRPKKTDSKESKESMEDRKSPREHLRRGHIRHLPSGLKIWINNMVINAGIGGRVTKDYVLL